MNELALFVPCEVWTVNSERRMHHFARAAKVTPVRETAKLLALNWARKNRTPTFAGPVYVEFTPVQKPGVLADTANHLPPCKAVLDGIVDAGLIPDDRPEWVRWQTFMPPQKDRNTGVNVRIAEL